MLQLAKCCKSQYKVANIEYARAVPLARNAVFLLVPILAQKKHGAAYIFAWFLFVYALCAPNAKTNMLVSPIAALINVQLSANTAQTHSKITGLSANAVHTHTKKSDARSNLGCGQGRRPIGQRKPWAWACLCLGPFQSILSLDQNLCL